MSFKDIEKELEKKLTLLRDIATWIVDNTPIKKITIDCENRELELSMEADDNAKEATKHYTR